MDASSTPQLLFSFPSYFMVSFGTDSIKGSEAECSWKEAWQGY